MRLFRRTMLDSKEICFRFVRFMQREMNKLNSKEFADFIGSSFFVIEDVLPFIYVYYPKRKEVR